MKKSNIFLIVILFLTTFAIVFALPPLVRKATISNDKYPFVYYSSQLEELCLIDYSNKQTPMEDLKGRKYTTAEFDTLLPLLNYRQLMANGMLPDSICGVSAEPRNLMINSVTMRYDPKDRDMPKSGLYAMLETMPLRVGLTQPTDMFRIDDRVEFIDAQTNSVDEVKSAKFQQEMLKRGYQFPTQWVVGDANTRKAYDEGYFCLDSNGELFHLKMVNNRPFIKNTNVADSIDIAYFAAYAPSNRRFYGYLLSKQGEIYLLESDEQGGYRPLVLDVGAIDIENEKVLVMGNILYWTVTITSSESRRYVAIRSDDLSSVATHVISREPNMWDRVSKYLMPFTIHFESDNSGYIYPRIGFTGGGSLVVTLLLALLSLLLFRRESVKVRALSFLFVIASGVAGLIALLVLPKFKN